MARHRTCEYCKAKLIGEEKICPNCGAPVAPAVTPTSRAPHKSVPAAGKKSSSAATIIIIAIIIIAFSFIGVCAST